MLTCESSQSQLLDHLYGLLDPSESALLEVHMTTCAHCVAKREELAKWQGLVASAAKGEFASTKFTAPVEKPSQLIEVNEPVPYTVRAAWMRWVIAASLFLATAGLGGPAARDLAGYYWYKPSVDREVAGLEKAINDRTQLMREVKVVRAKAKEQLDDAQAKLDALTDTWMKAEQVAITTTADRPFIIEVTGPTTALVGAPNDYKLQVRDKNGQKKTVLVEAKVKDKDNTELYAESFEEADKVIKLPASLWTKVKPGSELTLHISATDKSSGKTAVVTEKVRLQDPVYTTFLTTDKPMYRPGETVYYRSLTLDRTTFLPSNLDLNVKFEVVAPSGQVVAGSDLVGLAKPATATGEPIFGPDGKPIRGVGTGAFALPPTLDGGEYKVRSFELAVNEFNPRPDSQPLAERKFIVNKYTPDRLQKKLEFDGKTYGPGDSVQAKIEVRDQAKVLSGATLDITVVAKIAGQLRSVLLDVGAKATNKDGTAAIKFTLPPGDLDDATLTVTVRNAGVTETLVRKVPLASRKLDVEFFPEGGDLVVGVPCKVYFRATTNTGKPADIQGTLTDGTTTLVDVKTLTDADHPGANQGLGSFTFTPQNDQKYSVKLSKPIGIIPPAEQGYKLPDVKPNGVMLTVLDGVTKPGEKLRIQLGTSGAKRNVVIGVYTRGRPLAHQKATIEPGQLTSLALDLGTSQIGGVTRVTVFEEVAEGDDGKTTLLPLAERLVFRSPGQTLKLGFNVTKAGGATVKGSFVPGNAVELSINAYDEAGRPKAAILWAAVVNQSVLTMADEKTARLLPTHFLLCGEVRKPDDLEHADFLLTDHPKAAVALDLLLGTQGWRRFAEQAPESFRQRVPAEDADRLLVVMGAKSPTPVGWKPDVRRVFDEYWPQYEAMATDVESIEKAQRSGANFKETDAAGNAILVQDQMHRSKLQEVGQELYFYNDTIDYRRYWLIVTLPLLLGCGVICVAIRVALGSQAPERRWLKIGALGFLLLGLFLTTTVLLTSLGNKSWVVYVQKLKPNDPFKVAMAAPATVAPPGRAQDDEGKDDAFLGGPGGRGGPGEFAPQNRMEKALPMQAGKAPGGPAAMRRAAPKADEAKKRVAPPEMMPQGRAMPMRQFENAAEGDEMADRRIGGKLRANHMLQLRGAGGRLQTAMIRQQQAAVRDGISLTPEQQNLWSVIERELPKTKPLVVRQYAHTRPTAESDGQTRTDFTETLLWQPVIVTPQDGTAQLTFTLSDAVNAYQVLIAGHTLDGRVGAMTGMIEVRKPFVVEPKLPQEIGSSDKLDIPVVMTNGTDETQKATVTMDLTGLKADGTANPFTAEIPANGGTRKMVRLLPEKQDGELAVKLTGNAGPGLQDAVERKLTVVPDGFPVQGAVSDLLEKQTTAKLTLPTQWIPGTLKATVMVYPNTLSELQAGLDGLLREPYGCFEQTSTTNYPNVLIMEYLKETNQAKPEIAKRAKDLMEKGYGRLTSYECPKTGIDTRVGFEWFGAKDRAHEALTAYGLVQFTDMAKVYAVDPVLLKRTKEFLVNSRDGNGGFKRNSVALDSFGRAPNHVTNAYIVWAITESEKGTATQSDLTREIDALLKLATEKDGKAARDPYFLALVANTLLNRSKQAEAVTLLQTIATMQAKDGSVPGAETSITNSQGRDLLIETTAYAVLGWIKAGRPELFVANTQNAMKWVGSQRNGSGSFGSTQSTILALKALIEYARSSKKPAESGTLRVFVSGNEVAMKAFTNQDSGPIVVEIPDADATFKPGITEVRVETTTKESYPLSVAWSCRTRQPISSPECAVKLDTKLNKATMSEGESVRLDVSVQNLQDKAHGMVIAIVGIPAGLKLPEDMKQLKALTDKPVDGTEPTISYWETRGRELVIYWRGMTPNQAITFGLDLIAETPGEYRGPASRAYLYYNADHKHWIAPVDVTIK